MEFRIISETNNAQYEYKNTGIIVQGNYAKDATNGNLQNISGSCYRNNQNEQGEYIGNFNGYMRGEEVKYSLSEMTRQDSNLVWGAIEDIEGEIIPVDA
jgi:hypothetical protein